MHKCVSVCGQTSHTNTHRYHIISNTEASILGRPAFQYVLQEICLQVVPPVLVTDQQFLRLHTSL